jgi:hypothetical protein
MRREGHDAALAGDGDSVTVWHRISFLYLRMARKGSWMAPESRQPYFDCKRASPSNHADMIMVSR